MCCNGCPYAAGMFSLRLGSPKRASSPSTGLPENLQFDVDRTLVGNGTLAVCDPHRTDIEVAEVTSRL